MKSNRTPSQINTITESIKTNLGDQQLLCDTEHIAYLGLKFISQLFLVLMTSKFVLDFPNISNYTLFLYVVAGVLLYFIRGFVKTHPSRTSTGVTAQTWNVAERASEAIQKYVVSLAAVIMTAKLMVTLSESASYSPEYTPLLKEITGFASYILELGSTIGVVILAVLAIVSFMRTIGFVGFDIVMRWLGYHP